MAAKKRANGEGTIYRRSNGTWSAQYTIWTPTGKKRRVVSGKTQAEVNQKLTRAKAERDGGLVFDDENLRLGDYLQRWLEECVRNKVSASTYERYEYAIRPHILPSLGDIKLKSLTPQHVRSFYCSKLDSGLAPATVHKLHVVLHKALDQAVSDGMIPRNVAAGETVSQESREEVVPLSREQAESLLEAARGERLEALYVLALTAGLRLGELLALRWEDVDLEKGTLAVQRSLTRAEGSWRVGNTKTRKSRRVRLSAGTVASLQAHRKRQLEERMRLSGLWQDNDLVFPNETGDLFNPSNLRNRSFKRIKERAGIPAETHFHALRHTCATLLLAEGVNPKVVSERLGHSSVVITLNRYSHVLPDMQEKATEVMESVLL